MLPKSESLPRIDRDNRLAFIILVCLAIPVFYFSIFNSFVRESGDNIVHYYFARYAFADPLLFFDHWAKPVFTFLAAPFAWFGFEGMKLFNGLTGLATAWILYLTARTFGFRMPWLTMILLFFAPTYFSLLFSGYTEPLFGLFLAGGIFLVARRKMVWAAILFSFLPFVRTEGFFIALILGVYLLWIKNWKAIPYLVTGSLFLTLSGWMMGKDFLWILTDMPYPVKSPYGTGKLSFYAEQWMLMLGVPLTLSFIAGMILLPFGFRKKEQPASRDARQVLYILIPAFFLSYFLFHTLSWYFGLFGSLGLIRILVPLVPLQALISLYALQILILQNGRMKIVSAITLALFLGYVLVFPFTGNPAAFRPEKDFRESPVIELMHDIGKDVARDYPGRYLYYSEPFFSYVFNINPFDKSLHMNFTEIPPEALRSGSVLIWDNWSSVNFVRFSHDLDGLSRMKQIRVFEVDTPSGKLIFKLYLLE